MIEGKVILRLNHKIVLHELAAAVLNHLQQLHPLAEDLIGPKKHRTDMESYLFDRLILL